MSNWDYKQSLHEILIANNVNIKTVYFCTHIWERDRYNISFKPSLFSNKQYIAEFTDGLLLEKEDAKKVQELINAIRKIYGFRRKFSKLSEEKQTYLKLML